MKKYLLKSLLATLATSFLIVGAQASDNAEEASNRALTLKYFKEMFLQRNIDEAAKLLADDYVTHHQPIETKAEMIARFTKQAAKMPSTARLSDAEVAARLPAVVLAKEDYVMFMHKMSSAAGGEQKTDAFGFDLYKIKNGKLIEHWDLLPARPAQTSPATKP